MLNKKDTKRVQVDRRSREKNLAYKIKGLNHKRYRTVREEKGFKISKPEAGQEQGVEESFWLINSKHKIISEGSERRKRIKQGLKKSSGL